MLPDDPMKVRRAKKVVDNGTGPFAIPLAQLTESIITNDKLDQLTEAVKSIEIPEYPEIEIPEPKDVVFPEVQKVEIVNPPKDKDDREVKKLLQELVTEVKKKEQYTYDIEVDSDLKEQLRGEKGEQGEPGTAITPSEVRDKLEELQGEDRLDASAIKGLDNLVKETKVFGSRLLRNLADVNGAKEATTGQVLTKQADGTFGFENGGGSGSESFETVSANLSAYDYSLSYNGNGDVTSIVYSNGVTKIFNYTGDDITSIVLSGSTPSGISLTKTLTYTSGDVTGIAYS